MTEWKLPRLISNGMVLAQKQKCRIWGWDAPGRKVSVSFLDEEYHTFTDAEGRWQLQMREHTSGGPYVMRIYDDAGNESVIENVLIGDVWFCSGQSNMELPMERVKDAFPEEFIHCNNPFIRSFKIVENVDYHGPLEELQTGEWQETAEDNISAFSATAYFFAKTLYRMTGVPVGFVDATLGGSRLEGWMGRDMLTGYEEYLALADTYADDDFLEAQKEKNLKQDEVWFGNLDREDIGLKESWEQESADWTQGCAVSLPFFFKDTELKDFIGAVWFKRTFHVPDEMAGKDAHLWLGTIVDSDTTFVNGVEVGRTEYQYPPRKYEVPGSLLRAGENSIVIRVKVDNGFGRVTVDKKYAIWNDGGEVELTGEWQYRIGAACEMRPQTDFTSWKPTGLYNGMTAPCHNYTVTGVLWYQGESNAGEPEEYRDLFPRLVSGYRRKWQNEKLPVYYVQLPNFTIDMYNNPEVDGREWGPIREAQASSLTIPDTGMVVTIDLGEDNDIHPLNKKGIGERLALLAAAHVHGMDVEYSGPVPVSTECRVPATGKGCEVHITCEHADNGMYAANPDKGDAIRDFELLDAEGNVYEASVVLQGSTIIVSSNEIAHPCALRYCYKNSPDGGVIYNKEGLPMSPFVMDID